MRLAADPAGRPRSSACRRDFELRRDQRGRASARHRPRRSGAGGSGARPRSAPGPMTTVDLGRALPRARRLDPGLVTWLAALAVTAACFAVRDRLPWVAAYPSAWVLPIADWINVFTDWFNNLFQPFFRAISFALDRPMRGVQAILQWLPWPSVMLLVGALALRAGGWRLALFAIAALAYLVIVGYWRQSMNTLALVLLAVPLSIVAGFILGVLA